MSDLLELAERAEATDSKCDLTELEAEIVLALEQPDYRFPGRILNRKPDSYREAARRFRWDGGGGHVAWPRYLHSVDAAIRLAEGQEWCGGAAGLLREAMDRMSALPIMVSQMAPEEYARTLARFLTAACLRARAKAPA